MGVFSLTRKNTLQGIIKRRTAKAVLLLIDNAFHCIPRKNISQFSFFAIQKENKIHMAIAPAVTLARGVKLWKGKPQHF